MSNNSIIKASVKAIRVRIQTLASAARIFAMQLHAADSRRLPG